MPQPSKRHTNWCYSVMGVNERGGAIVTDSCFIRKATRRTTITMGASDSFPFANTNVDVSAIMIAVRNSLVLAGWALRRALPVRNGER